MLIEYSRVKEVKNFPRLPLKGNIDLTYRCNNNCRHCWLRIPAAAQERTRELTFEEIKNIIDEAREMGCREWLISGGEPMLRADFSEIFDYITSNSAYSLNTNGTLITPKIAKLLKRKGHHMVALYGATADVHDHITRNPGSFEATMRGFAYLKETGARFMVQIVPMRDNYYQFQEMVHLAESLNRHWRIGARLFYLSACGDKEINREIIRQRLYPKEVIELNKPDVSFEYCLNKETQQYYCTPIKNDYLFASCIAEMRRFHIDPYGQMTFCSFIKDPAFRYDLRKGTIKKCWEEFIPSLVDKVKFTKKYFDSCGSCGMRGDCRWCPAYAYLEHRNFEEKIDYLCEVAKEQRRFKTNWQKNHRRYFKIADITIQVDSDLPIKDETFHPKFKLFEVDAPGEDTAAIRHYFSLPDLNGQHLGREVYRKPPWAIYKKDDHWIYLGISPSAEDKKILRTAVFNYDYTRARIYHKNEKVFLKGNLGSLTLFPTDQILLARLLADRGGCYFHASGVSLDGKGLLFVGHSEAGKSTIVRMLKDKSEILCDDRMIVRKYPDGFEIYGTWSHGDVPDISGNSAPLRAVLFLKKAKENRLILLDDKRDIAKRILSCLIKPFVTVDWWEKTLAIVDKMIEEVPCYVLRFGKSGGVADLLRQLTKE